MQNPRFYQQVLNHAITKNILLLLFLYAIVLIADFPILQKDIMYPEQPTMYLVNQTIHSWRDLLNVYLHPKALDDVIPFFRPSGHFLIYQLLTPIFGWHNTRALVAVNLFFLALTGLLMIKLYQLFFPSHKMGAYFAFGFYLMHPALIMSRFLLLHFEFAYVFFLMAGLYCFVVFCQKNLANAARTNQLLQFQYFSWLASALLLYFIAVTFKEGAIMLGPVMLVYFSLYCYRQFFNKQAWEIIILLIAATLAFGLYLTLAWPSLQHPQLDGMVKTLAGLAVVNQFLLNLLGMDIKLLANHGVEMLLGGGWRFLVFTPLARILILLFLVVGLVTTGWEIKKTRNTYVMRAVAFLLIAVMLFLVLPILWRAGFPWHWNLSILFLSFILGFGTEVFCKHLLRAPILLRSVSAGLFAAFIVAAIQVNAKNINSVLAIFPSMKLTRAAIFQPPAIREQLTADSIILVAVTKMSAYELGNSRYNYLATGTDFKVINADAAWIYRRHDDWRYNGTLFKWAYLIPGLREEVFPFSLKKMQNVSSDEIYQWLENLNNIYCFTIDERWHDVTAQFKKNLAREQAIRHLSHYSYAIQYAQKIKGYHTNSKKLPFPESLLCRYECDQDVDCKGFVYIDNSAASHPWISCEYFSAVTDVKSATFCPNCVSYVKQTQIPF